MCDKCRVGLEIIARNHAREGEFAAGKSEVELDLVFERVMRRMACAFSIVVRKAQRKPQEIVRDYIGDLIECAEREGIGMAVEAHIAVDRDPTVLTPEIRRGEILH